MCAGRGLQPEPQSLHLLGGFPPDAFDQRVAVDEQSLEEGRIIGEVVNVAHHNIS